MMHFRPAAASLPITIMAEEIIKEKAFLKLVACS